MAAPSPQEKPAPSAVSTLPPSDSPHVPCLGTASPSREEGPRRDVTELLIQIGSKSSRPPVVAFSTAGGTAQRRKLRHTGSTCLKSH